MSGPPFRRAPRFALVGSMLIALHGLLWTCFPSNFIHVDAFDELMVIEGPVCVTSPKHVLAEPTLWGAFQVLRDLGYEGNAVRPVQMGNGFLVTLMLVAVALAARRRGVRPVLALGIPLLLGATYAALHLAVDPYLSYWPPALALATLALVAATFAGWRGGTACAVLLSIALLYNPMTIFLVPGIVAARLFPPGAAARAPGRRVPIRALALVVLPAAVFVVAFAQGRLAAALVGPWGRFFPETFAYASVAIERMFQPTPDMVPPFEPALATLRQTAWILLLAAAVPIAGALALCAVRSPAGLLWLGGILGSALFALWWDPGQLQFWLLPLWVALLAFVERGGLGDAAPVGPIAGFLLAALRPLPFAAGAVLLVANVLTYVLPSARTDDPERAIAVEVAQAFAPVDLLVYPFFQELRLEYWGRRQTEGMVALAAHRRPGETTFDHRERRRNERAALGGRTWLHVRPDGAPIVHPYMFEQGDVDFTAEDFQRLRWGEQRVIRDRHFREILGIDETRVAAQKPPAAPR